MKDLKYEYIHNKGIVISKSKKYSPDFLFKTRTHVVILEVDENKHSGYKGEYDRQIALCEYFNCDTFFIRYYPGKNLDQNHNRMFILKELLDCSLNIKFKQREKSFEMITMRLFYEKDSILKTNMLKFRNKCTTLPIIEETSEDKLSNKLNYFNEYIDKIVNILKNTPNTIKFTKYDRQNSELYFKCTLCNFEDNSLVIECKNCKIINSFSKLLENNFLNINKLFGNRKDNFKCACLTCNNELIINTEKTELQCLYCGMVRLEHNIVLILEYNNNVDEYTHRWLCPNLHVTVSEEPSIMQLIQEYGPEKWCPFCRNPNMIPFISTRVKWTRVGDGDISKIKKENSEKNAYEYRRKREERDRLKSKKSEKMKEEEKEETISSRKRKTLKISYKRNAGNYNSKEIRREGSSGTIETTPPRINIIN